MFDFTPAPAETKPDVFTLPSLYAWLRMQPPKREYTYICRRGCLLYQYFKAAGLDVREVGYNYWTDHDGKDHRFPDALHDVANASVPTMGAAAIRCRAAMEKVPA